MINETIKKVEFKLEEMVARAKIEKLEYVEVVNLIKSAMTFHAVVKIISKYDGTLTLSELEKNSKLLSSIYINCYRLNNRIDDIDKLMQM